MAEPLSSVQYVAVTTGFVCAALLSLLGSAAVIVAARKNLQSTYQRLIFSVSAADAMSSLTIMIHPFLVPSGTPTLSWAIGNERTCAVAGFFLTVCKSAVSVYSAALAIFFFCKVRYNVGDSSFAKFLLPVHFVAIVLPCTVATWGVANSAYAPRVLIRLCSLGDCRIGQTREECPSPGLVEAIVGWLATGAFVLIPCLIAIVCTLGVYCTVRSQAQRNSRYAAASAEYISEVRSQGTLYALAYLNSMIWILVIGVLAGDIDVQNREGKTGMFTIQMMASLMYPLQGFLNFAVYARPRYLDWRMHGYTRLGAIAKAMALEPYEPHRSRRNKLQPVSLRCIEASNGDSKKTL